MEFLKRNEAPLTESQWQEIDNTVIETARKTLIGRRFIEISTLPDPSIQSINYDIIDSGDYGACGLFGEQECGVVQIKDRKFLPLPILYKDFKIHWRDIEYAKKINAGIDKSIVATATVSVCIAEDQLIFHGDATIGYPGLLNVVGRNSISISEWNKTGNAFEDVLQAIQVLNDAGFYSNFALILNTKDYAKLHRVYSNTGILEIEQIRKLCDFGIFATPVIPPNTAIVLSAGIENMDILVAQDMITAYINYENMDHYFRIFEILALRIKRPESICTIE
ncbi:family 1 encapsulin nanocompartment shell protein [Venenivibrio stagnispumantis]|uniref:Uncharacterized protein, linocin/CFP29 family n=1 Tax=Venenivibrio stagnispumantis TaxID=407998 RepID=A0AA46AED5_9AQUI|nr:family 1 encapsulin nanocompartment shell protein [Venenivibrio stagnispumantis]MCW4572893.1 family 1 encapsulin nanocompartment shell protein [Venenivibrio stagnispumantis]SMP12819.1 Uncharacterized protein, linocin/CFP29 family [Venenivibrio stagnispumantis]